MGKPKISVIVPVKNEEEKIERCLDAIFSQTIKPFEVIVVDGHSADRTEENAKKFPVNFLYENYHTRAGACQMGAENAKGDFIAFTDADCIPEKNWLENLVKELDRNNIVGVGGGIKNIGNGLWEKSINLAMDTFLGSANSVQGRLFKDKKFVKSISGCNSMYRKKDILDVGGFDVRLLTAEDTELNSKLLKIGKLIYIPNAIILHNPNRGLRKFGERMYQYGYGRANGRLYDVQILPPIFGLLLIISTLFIPRIVLSFVVLYIVLIETMGIKFSVQEKSFIYLVSIPIVYLTEHLLYAIGFWKGLLSTRR